jgi:hypothetical protein
MDIVIAIIGVWLVLLGAYGLLPVLRRNGGREGRPPKVRIESAWTPASDSAPIAASPSPEKQYVGTRQVAAQAGPDSEIDFLRRQVEQLRSELVAYSGRPALRDERPRLRRYRVGLYTRLPSFLRQRIRESRLSRRSFSV